MLLLIELKIYVFQLRKIVDVQIVMQIFYLLTNDKLFQKIEKILSNLFFCIRMCIQYNNVAMYNIYNYFGFCCIFSFNYFFNYQKSIHLDWFKKKIKRLRLIRLSLDKIVFSFQREIRLRRLALWTFQKVTTPLS